MWTFAKSSVISACTVPALQFIVPRHPIYRGAFLPAVSKYAKLLPILEETSAPLSRAARESSVALWDEVSKVFAGAAADERGTLSKKFSHFLNDDQTGLLRSRSSAKPSFSVPDVLRDGVQTDAELVKLATPERIRSSPLFPAHDLSLFDRPERLFPGRHIDGSYYRQEKPFLRAMERHFHSGDIDANTLVVSNVGHTPTVAYAMSQRFRSDVLMHLPQNSFAAVPGDQLGELFGLANKARVLSQGRTFFEPMATAVSQGAREGGSTLLAVETHSTVPLSRAVVDSLPSADTLRSIGINKVFYGSEGYPYAFGARAFSGFSQPEFRDLSKWLTSLKDSKMQVIEDGIDMRPLNWRGERNHLNFD